MDIFDIIPQPAPHIVQNLPKGQYLASILDQVDQQAILRVAQLISIVDSKTINRWAF